MHRWYLLYLCQLNAELMIQIREAKFKDRGHGVFTNFSLFLFFTHAVLFSFFLLHKLLRLFRNLFYMFFFFLFFFFYIFLPFSITIPIVRFPLPCFLLSVPSLSALPHLHSLFLCFFCLCVDFPFISLLFNVLLGVLPSLFTLPSLPSTAISSALPDICRAQQNAVGCLTHNPLVWHLVAVFIIVPNQCLIILWHTPTHTNSPSGTLSSLHHLSNTVLPLLSPHSAFRCSWMEGRVITN